GTFSIPAVREMFIGQRPSLITAGTNHRFLRGGLDEFTIYGRALQPNEVYALHSAGATGKCPPSDNEAPVVNAGPDQAIGSAGGTALLNGSTLDDGKPNAPLRFAWSQISGPGLTEFADPASPTTVAAFPAAGIYVIALSASDGECARSDTVEIRVGIPCT